MGQTEGICCRGMFARKSGITSRQGEVTMGVLKSLPVLLLPFSMIRLRRNSSAVRNKCFRGRCRDPPGTFRAEPIADGKDPDRRGCVEPDGGRRIVEGIGAHHPADML